MKKYKTFEVRITYRACMVGNCTCRSDIARAALRDTATPEQPHPSTEAEALALMGAGQPLMKMREIE